MIRRLSTLGLKGYCCFYEVVADASVGCFGYEEQACGGDGIDPAAWSDAAVVFGFCAGAEASVAEGGRAEGEQVCGCGEDSAAVGALERELLSAACDQVPGAGLGVDCAVI